VWSEWEYSSEEVRDALASLERREAMQAEAMRYLLSDERWKPDSPAGGSDGQDNLAVA
jgi:hypothetical protein